MTKSTRQNFAEGEQVMYHANAGWCPAVVLNPHAVPNWHGTRQLKLRVTGKEYDWEEEDTFDTTCVSSRARVLKLAEFNEKIKPELDRQAAEKQLDEEAETRRRYWYAEQLVAYCHQPGTDAIEAVAAQLDVWYRKERTVAYNAYYKAHPEEECR